MSAFLRTIKHQRWLQEKDGDLQAAALKDIFTSDSTLSVWKADSGIGIDRIVAAVAASGTSVAQLDYVLLEREWLESHGFLFAFTPNHGQTPDRDVNDLHYDIQSLTVYKLYDLALYMSTRIRTEGPIIGPQVAKLIDLSISLCHFHEECLNEKLLKSLKKQRKQQTKPK